MLYSCFLYLCIFLFCFDDALCKKRSHSKILGGKIVGGYNTTIENIPYQAYMIVEKGGEYYQCGGSIISSRYILTAAHCLTGVETVYLRLGSTDSEEGGTVVSSRTFVQHPRYNAQTSDFDAALVSLANPIKLDGKKTKAVKLPRANSQVPAESNVLVSGWGDTTEGGTTSRNLMAVVVKVVSETSCKNNYSTLTKRMFCAGAPEGGKDSCQGDSGGPAVNDNHVQVGIVSFGMGCARAGYPGVYTKVSDVQVRSWIRSVSGV